MRILAIDTSLGSGSVAAVDTGGTEIRPLGAAGEHARCLTAALIDVASRRGWGSGSAALSGLGPADVIAVIRGPGSFTGLRVGVTAAKALAWTTGARLVGISGFDAIARQTSRLPGWGSAGCAIAYDAGRGEVFATLASVAADAPLGWRCAEPALATADDWLRSLPHGARISGPGLDSCLAGIAARGDLCLAPREAWLPSAAAAATLAGILAASGHYDDPHTLLPDYLRPSYADEKQPPRG